MEAQQETLQQRLISEWRKWSMNHPSGFEAQLMENPNGTLNVRQWNCSIPGPKSSPWEGGMYNLILNFSYNFPAYPPLCRFDPPIFHPNVAASGEIYISELLWHSDFTIADILGNIQSLLKTPNMFGAENAEVQKIYLSNFAEYERQVREYAVLMGAKKH